MINNPRPIVVLTLLLVALGIFLGILSGFPEVFNLLGKDLHYGFGMVITATDTNLKATNDVVKSTQDYHAWVVTTTSMPLQQTSSIQNAQLAMADMQNKATQAAFENNIQATKSAEQFVAFQTAFANYGQSTVEARKILATEEAIQLMADKEKYNFQLTQTQAAVNFQLIQTQAVVDQEAAAKKIEIQAKNDQQQSILGLGIAIIVAVPIILTLGVLGWVLINFLRGFIGGQGA